MMILHQLPWPFSSPVAATLLLETGSSRHGFDIRCGHPYRIPTTFLPRTRMSSKAILVRHSQPRPPLALLTRDIGVRPHLDLGSFFSFDVDCYLSTVEV